MVRLKKWLPVVVALLGLAGGLAAGGADKPRTGFIDKVYKTAGGYEAKYVVFVPHHYDGKEALPVVLFLHGSGAVGNDGRKQAVGALAKAIRKDEKNFAFISVFPQSHEGSWTADSVDGKRAMAILDEVSNGYKVDTKRTYLTGLSMGGEGTWSLAAAHPDRWAAIVPLCGGGDPRIAAKIKDIPCWCFHGDADKVVPAAASRKMIRALWHVGGQPLYHEFPDVGHDCWDRVYAMPDLYEWLLLQKLKYRCSCTTARTTTTNSPWSGSRSRTGRDKNSRPDGETWNQGVRLRRQNSWTASLFFAGKWVGHARPVCGRDAKLEKA